MNSKFTKTAEEDRGLGKARIRSYWRVVRDDGSLNETFPGGTEAQVRRLREEGHQIEPGKSKHPPKVRDFQASLVTL